MRFIKLPLISIAVLFAVIVVISLFFPSHVRISRAVNIRAPQDSIEALVGNIPEWNRWLLFVNFKELKNAHISDTGIVSDQLHIRRNPSAGDTLKTTWRQPSGRQIDGTFAWHTEGDVTVVQWYFDFHLRWYPWEKFGSIVFDNQIGPPMEKSLDTLKKILEKPR